MNIAEFKKLFVNRINTLLCGLETIRTKMFEEVEEPDDSKPYDNDVLRLFFELAQRDLKMASEHSLSIKNYFIGCGCINIKDCEGEKITRGEFFDSLDILYDYIINVCDVLNDVHNSFVFRDQDPLCDCLIEDEKYKNFLNIAELYFDKIIAELNNTISVNEEIIDFITANKNEACETKEKRK